MFISPAFSGTIFVIIEEERCTTAPTLEGERIIVRAHQPSDFDACCKLWAEPEVVRYISGKLPADQILGADSLNMLAIGAFAGLGIGL